MVSDPGPSRRRIILGVLGFCVLLVIVGAMLPSASERRIEQKRRATMGLKPVAAPPKGQAAAKIDWFPGTSPELTRSVTIHFYQKIGGRTVHTDLLQPYFNGASGTTCRTILHLAYDPKDADQVELATAIALTANDRGNEGARLRQEAALGFGATVPPKIKRQVAKILGAKDRLTRSVYLARLQDERASGRATAYPHDTVLYEVGGRFYQEPPPTPPSATAPAGFGASGYGYRYSRMRTVLLDALTDPRVRLP